MPEKSSENGSKAVSLRGTLSVLGGRRRRMSRRQRRRRLGGAALAGQLSHRRYQRRHSLLSVTLFTNNTYIRQADDSVQTNQAFTVTCDRSEILW